MPNDCSRSWNGTLCFIPAVILPAKNEPLLRVLEKPSLNGWWKEWKDTAEIDRFLVNHLFEEATQTNDSRFHKSHVEAHQKDSVLDYEVAVDFAPSEH